MNTILGCGGCGGCGWGGCGAGGWGCGGWIGVTEILFLITLKNS